MAEQIFIARKADDLGEDEIRRMYVAPVEDFVRSLCLPPTHHLLRGGRGSGKTISLRYVSHRFNPPGPNHPALAVYVPVDITELSPFQESKIGSQNAWALEAYYSAKLAIELLSAIDDAMTRPGILMNATFVDHAADALGLGRAGNCGELIQNLRLLNKRIRDAAVQTAAHIDTAIAAPVIGFFELNSLCRAVATDLTISGAAPRVSFLIDRYDDLSPFQQTVTNALFKLPSPRYLHIKAAVGPNNPTSLPTLLGQAATHPQDFALLNLEEVLDKDGYIALLGMILTKLLTAAKEARPGSQLLTSAASLLESKSDVPYSGFAALAELSDGIIFNFLYLCETAVNFGGGIDHLHGGGTVSAEAQNRAAKDAARWATSAISSKVGSDSATLKHVVDALLKKAGTTERGPRVVFKEGRTLPQYEVLERLLAHSLIKETSVDVRSQYAPTDLVADLNRILLPTRGLPLVSREPMVVTPEDISKLIADAESFRIKRPKRTEQPQLFDIALRPSAPPWHDVHVDGHMLKAHVDGSEDLIESIQYSADLLRKANRELTKGLFKELAGQAESLSNISVGIAGSYARGEAQQGLSDADLFVVRNTGVEHDTAERVLQYACDWFREQGIEITERPSSPITDPRFQPFPLVMDLNDLLTRAATSEDAEEDKTRRMCLVAESSCVFNDDFFHRSRSDIANRYRVDELLALRSLPVALLKEFKEWCEGFRSRVTVHDKSGPKHDKRLFQRTFMEKATLLACLAHVVDQRRDKYETLMKIFEMPPLFRLLHILETASQLRDQLGPHVTEVRCAYNNGAAALRAIAKHESIELVRLFNEADTTLAKHFAMIENILLAAVKTEATRRQYHEV